MTITNEAELQKALERIDELFEVDDPDSAEGMELTALLAAVDKYEFQHYPMD